MRYCEHNTQAIFFYALIFKTIKTAERLKHIRIRKFEYDILSISFNVTSSETRRENEFLKSKFESHDTKSSMGPSNLFDLNDFLNYVSSNDRSFLIRIY